MTVYELNRDQIIELKQAYFSDKLNEINQCISYDELVDIDSIVSDKDIYAYYECYDFSQDDFFCTAGKE